MNIRSVHVLVMLILALAAVPAIAAWSIHTPSDDMTYVYPDSEIFAAGDGLELEEFRLYLRKDGQPYQDWLDSTDEQGVWDRSPLSVVTLPVGEYYLYVSFGSANQADREFEVVPDDM